MKILGLTLGDWRHDATDNTDLLARARTGNAPGIYVLSARCVGIKGALAGARHSWISVFDGDGWVSVEITDAETLGLQLTREGSPVQWRCYGEASQDIRRQLPYRSNRSPDALWFGQTPRIDLAVTSPEAARRFLERLDTFCAEYPFRNAFTLLDNNCSKFVSYLVWRNRLLNHDSQAQERRLKLIGFRGAAYWRLAVASLANAEDAPSRAGGLARAGA